MPELHVPASARSGQACCLVHQRARHRIGIRQDAAKVHERERRHGAPEQPAANLDDGKDADDLSALTGGQVETLMPERPLEDAPPGPLVVSGRVRFCLDKGVPLGAIVFTGEEEREFGQVSLFLRREVRGHHSWLRSNQ